MPKLGFGRPALTAARTASGWLGLADPVAKPQSLPAMTLSRRTRLALGAIGCAINSPTRPRCEQRMFLTRSVRYKFSCRRTLLPRLASTLASDHPFNAAIGPADRAVRISPRGKLKFEPDVTASDAWSPWSSPPAYPSVS